MTSNDNGNRAPVEIGEPAPDFVLPAIHREGQVSLADFRGQQPLFLAIERGLWCPFCRRHIAQLGATRGKLASLGVETLVVVNSSLERARLYFRFRPASVPLVADPEAATHRTYGLPSFDVEGEIEQALNDVRIDPTGEVGQPVPAVEIMDRLNDHDRFAATDEDRERLAAQLRRVKLTGQFLLDREGIVRWRNIECAEEGLPGAGKFPSDDALLVVARSLSSNS